MCNIEISEMDLRVILSDYVGIPLKYCQTILETYSKTKILPFVKIDNYSDKYENFYNIFEEISQKLSLKVYEMFYRVVDFVDETKINKFNFFIKQLKDFERVLGDEVVKDRVKDIINQIENSIIAEEAIIGENAVIGGITKDRKITVIGGGVKVSNGKVVEAGAMVEKDI